MGPFTHLSPPSCAELSSMQGMRFAGRTGPPFPQRSRHSLIHMEMKRNSKDVTDLWQKWEERGGVGVVEEKLDSDLCNGTSTGVAGYDVHSLQLQETPPLPPPKDQERMQSDSDPPIDTPTFTTTGLTSHTYLPILPDPGPCNVTTQDGSVHAYLPILPPSSESDMPDVVSGQDSLSRVKRENFTHPDTFTSMSHDQMVVAASREQKTVALSKTDSYDKDSICENSGFITEVGGKETGQSVAAGHTLQQPQQHHHQQQHRQQQQQQQQQHHLQHQHLSRKHPQLKLQQKQQDELEEFPIANLTSPPYSRKKVDIISVSHSVSTQTSICPDDQTQSEHSPQCSCNSTTSTNTHGRGDDTEALTQLYSQQSPVDSSTQQDVGVQADEIPPPLPPRDSDHVYGNLLQTEYYNLPPRMAIDPQPPPRPPKPPGISGKPRCTCRKSSTEKLQKTFSEDPKPPLNERNSVPLDQRESCDTVSDVHPPLQSVSSHQSTHTASSRMSSQNDLMCHNAVTPLSSATLSIASDDVSLHGHDIEVPPSPPQNETPVGQRDDISAVDPQAFGLTLKDLQTATHTAPIGQFATQMLENVPTSSEQQSAYMSETFPMPVGQPPLEMSMDQQVWQALTNIENPTQPAVHEFHPDSQSDFTSDSHSLTEPTGNAEALSELQHLMDTFHVSISSSLEETLPSQHPGSLSQPMMPSSRPFTTSSPSLTTPPQPLTTPPQQLTTPHEHYFGVPSAHQFGSGFQQLQNQLLLQHYYQQQQQQQQQQHLQQLLHQSQHHQQPIADGFHQVSPPTHNALTGQSTGLVPTTMSLPMHLVNANFPQLQQYQLALMSGAYLNSQPPFQVLPGQSATPGPFSYPNVANGEMPTSLLGNTVTGSSGSLSTMSTDMYSYAPSLNVTTPSEVNVTTPSNVSAINVPLGSNFSDFPMGLSSQTPGAILKQPSQGGLVGVSSADTPTHPYTDTPLQVHLALNTNSNASANDPPVTRTTFNAPSPHLTRATTTVGASLQQTPPTSTVRTPPQQTPPTSTVRTPPQQTPPTSTVRTPPTSTVRTPPQQTPPTSIVRTPPQQTPSTSVARATPSQMSPSRPHLPSHLPGGVAPLQNPTTNTSLHTQATPPGPQFKLGSKVNEVPSGLPEPEPYLEPVETGGNLEHLPPSSGSSGGKKALRSHTTVRRVIEGPKTSLPYSIKSKDTTPSTSSTDGRQILHEMQTRLQSFDRQNSLGGGDSYRAGSRSSHGSSGRRRKSSMGGEGQGQSFSELHKSGMRSPHGSGHRRKTSPTSEGQMQVVGVSPPPIPQRSSISLGREDSSNSTKRHSEEEVCLDSHLPESLAASRRRQRNSVNFSNGLISELARRMSPTHTSAVQATQLRAHLH